jgi:hypothetical protein
MELPDRWIQKLYIFWYPYALYNPYKYCQDSVIGWFMHLDSPLQLSSLRFNAIASYNTIEKVLNRELQDRWITKFYTFWDPTELDSPYKYCRDSVSEWLMDLDSTMQLSSLHFSAIAS